MKGSSPLTRGKPEAPASAGEAGGLIPAHAGKTPRASACRGRSRAHPRSRGENRYLVNRRLRRRGSSPLTRGKRERHLASRLDNGLIPAHAGKTHVSRPEQSPARAHPRSRGENDATQKFADTLKGSSPLTRGKHTPREASRAPVRLIPAHAGKTGSPMQRSVSRRAHPRSRGENRVPMSAGCAPVGSSPLTRGKPLRGDDPQLRVRLIPAHAGKTSLPAFCPMLGRAHPRSRGENVLPSPSVPPDAGSSPLTRGKHLGDCAGQRRLVAHPRSRGENCEPLLDEWEIGGSSPLTRGKREPGAPMARSEGLIPAHAGKTVIPFSPLTCIMAHPRSRGENIETFGGASSLSGSSPLTRGKPGCTMRRARCIGLIPAHAGKTP